MYNFCWVLGIQQLPEVSKQRKHNFEDLNINEHVDSDDDNDSRSFKKIVAELNEKEMTM